MVSHCTSNGLSSLIVITRKQLFCKFVRSRASISRCSGPSLKLGDVGKMHYDEATTGDRAKGPQELHELYKQLEALFRCLLATQNNATHTFVLGPWPWPRGLLHPIRSSGRRGWRGPVSDAQGPCPIRSWPVDGGWARWGSPVDGGGRVRNPRRPSSRGSRIRPTAQPNPNHPGSHHAPAPRRPRRVSTAFAPIEARRPSNPTRRNPSGQLIGTAHRGPTLTQHVDKLTRGVDTGGGPGHRRPHGLSMLPLGY